MFQILGLLLSFSGVRVFIRRRSTVAVPVTSVTDEIRAWRRSSSAPNH